MKTEMRNLTSPPTERPRYTIGQAAQYLCISNTTLRSWVVGRPYPAGGGSRYSQPLIARPDEQDLRLSFNNLVEAHVLRALRTRHKVPMPAVRLLQAHLQRIDRNIEGLPVRLFPVSIRGLDGPKVVVIDPQVSFGRPYISGKGVRTSTIVERLDAGESREDVARDYGLEDFEIDEAILYERAA